METRPRILIVEDDQSWQGVYRDLLKALDYFGLVVGTKHEALLEVEKDNFDAFVIDIRLDSDDVGNKDGLTILRRLSERSEAGRAILYSANVTAGYREEIEQLGAFTVLEKNDPFPFRLLIDSLKTAVAQGGRT